MITLSVTIPQLLGWSYPFIDLPVHTFYHTFYHTFWVQNEQNVTNVRISSGVDEILVPTPSKAGTSPPMTSRSPSRVEKDLT